MAGNYVNKIDSYLNGDTGTIEHNGTSVDYTITRVGTGPSGASDPNRFAIEEVPGALSYAATSVKIEYDQAVEGIHIRHDAMSTNENYILSINGEDVNIGDLVTSGNITLLGSSSFDPATGYIEGAVNGANNGGYLITGIPINSITIRGDGTGNLGVDAFDYGIDSEEFKLSDGAVCFARGMMIATDRGDIAVEDLKLGDMVRTFDNGFQPIRFVYGWNVAAQGKKRPIVFEVGTIGNTKRIIVSQEHKILIDSVRRDLMPAPLRREDQMIKASLLVNGRNVFIDRTVKSVEYFHIMFDQHELIFCNGSVSESWQPKERNLRRNPALRSALLAQFPEFRALPNLARRPVRNEVCVFQKQGKNYIASTDNRRPS